MTRIRITIPGGELTATLENNAAAKDFLALLPMTLTLEDYSKTEKISDLPKRLATTGSADGHDPEIGDITYYAPWGNLAIFYKDFGYSRGLIKLGEIESDVSPLIISGPFEATFERVH